MASSSLDAAFTKRTRVSPAMSGSLAAVISFTVLSSFAWSGSSCLLPLRRRHLNAWSTMSCEER